MNRALRILGLAAVLTLVCSLLGMGPASAGQTDPDPTAGAPEVGACYDLSYKQVYAHSVPEAPVGCAETHTAIVAGVGTLPAGVTWSSPEKKTNAAVYEQCTRTVNRIVGKNPVLLVRSAYSWMWYRPSQAEQTDGARWFSCLLIVPEDKALAELPQRLPKAGKHLPDALAKCFVGRKYAATTCADRHDWRMTFSVLVHQRLTEKSMERASQHYCAAHVSTKTYLRNAYYVQARSFVLGCSAKTHR